MEQSDSTYQGLYKLSGITALVNAFLVVGEFIVYAVFSRPGTPLEHFPLFQRNWLVGLLTLDLLGMISYLLFVPIILAFYVALRRTSQALMAVATALYFVGIADFFATNTAFPVLALSQQYAAATTNEERAMVLAAGQAMFTLFNENAFLVSYVIVSASWLLISSVMLRSTLFSRMTASAGVLAGAAGMIAVVLEHVLGKAYLPVAIAFYFAAIVFLFLWVILTGRRLYHLGTLKRA